MPAHSLLTGDSEELRLIFDQQVGRVLSLIDQQLRVAQSTFPTEQIVSSSIALPVTADFQSLSRI